MGFHGGGERRLEVKVKKCIFRLINFKEIISLNIYFYVIHVSLFQNCQILCDELVKKINFNLKV